MARISTWITTLMTAIMAHKCVKPYKNTNNNHNNTNNNNNHHHNNSNKNQIKCIEPLSRRNGSFMFGGILVLLLCQIDFVNSIRRGRLMVPPSYTAQSGDLHVQLHTMGADLRTPPPNWRLQVSRIEEDVGHRTFIGAVDIYPDRRTNVTQVTVPCQFFLRGGTYELEITPSATTTTAITTVQNLDNELTNTTVVATSPPPPPNDERLRQKLDVRWPVPKLSVTPETIGTYPQAGVDAVLEFPGVECQFSDRESPDVPEFWLQLFFCGHDVYCDSTNVSSSQLLYAEQVRGFPRSRVIALRCDLFGLAGHYVLKLKPTAPTPAVVSASAFIKADWSVEFVFNVNPRSIFPCEPHTGIGVVFTYPACILDQADRVRLFAKLRADVASLAPPTSLHYVTEQRVQRGRHSLNFDCEQFSEKYIEYCFVYVSQALSGAVADVRMDCVPTQQQGFGNSGEKKDNSAGWGAWSEWTPCSTTCSGGTKNRYRFCDSPPPLYGEKFCEGSAVETDRCGGPESGTWECLYGSALSLPGEAAVSRADVIAEVGPGCRCGCIVHLGAVKPRRLIASSAQSCPGRTFWLIQAETDHRVHFKMEFFRLPCGTQYLRVRDGDSLASDMIGEYVGGTVDYPDTVVSSAYQILIEFFTDELATVTDACGGGFLAHAQQIPRSSNVTMAVPSKAVLQMSLADVALKLTIVHIAAILFVSFILVVSALLGAQYMCRYRKYQLAESIGEPDSPAHTPRASMTSLLPNGQPPSRAVSTSTLLSEVISLVKFRPRNAGRKGSGVGGHGHHNGKHARLRESVNDDTLDKVVIAHDPANDNATDCSGGGGTESSMRDKSNSEDELSVVSSTQTITNVDTFNSPDTDLATAANDTDVGSMRNSSSGSPPSLNSMSLPATPLATPHATPLPTRRAGIAGDTRSVNGHHRGRGLRKLDGVREEQTNEIGGTGDTATIRRGRRSKVLSVSNSTLTKVCHSPNVLAVPSRPPSSQKDNKDKRNRERLLAGPGSEFSLANAEDFELDYYDYNVVNAGAAPGSYLGMDPAYLVWIPPLDGHPIDDNEDNNDDNDNNDNNDNDPDHDDGIQHDRLAQPAEEEPFYEEIVPRLRSTKTPEDQQSITPPLPPLPPSVKSRRSLTDAENYKNALIHARRASNSSQHSVTMQEQLLATAKDNRFASANKLHGAAVQRSVSSRTIDDDHTNDEKETIVVKSPDNNVTATGEYYEMDDIKFVDDDEDGGSSVESVKNRIKYNSVKT